MSSSRPSMILDMHIPLEFFLWVPVCLCFVLCPCIAALVLKDKDFANDSSVVILTAPFPLCTVVWIMTGGSPSINPQAVRSFIVVLYVLGSLLFFISIYAAFVRSSAIYAQRGHKWAAMTFPLIAYTRSSLLFSNCIVEGDPFMCSELAMPKNHTVEEPVSMTFYAWSWLTCGLFTTAVAGLVLYATWDICRILFKGTNDTTSTKNRSESGKDSEDKESSCSSGTAQQVDDEVRDIQLA